MMADPGDPDVIMTQSSKKPLKSKISEMVIKEIIGQCDKGKETEQARCIRFSEKRWLEDYMISKVLSMTFKDGSLFRIWSPMGEGPKTMTRKKLEPKGAGRSESLWRTGTFNICCIAVVYTSLLPQPFSKICSAHRTHARAALWKSRESSQVPILRWHETR